MASGGGSSRSLARGGLTLNLNRRRTLGTIERLMSRYLKGGDAALATALDDSFRRELVFLLALSAYREGRVAARSKRSRFRICSPMTAS